MMEDRVLEEEADRLLEEDAKARGTTLYREGIIDKRRWYMIHRKELSLEGLTERRERRRQ